MAMPAAGALPVPPGWSDAEALGLVLNWATALAALKPLGEVEAGDVVLVHTVDEHAGSVTRIHRPFSTALSEWRRRLWKSLGPARVGKPGQPR